MNNMDFFWTALLYIILAEAVIFPLSYYINKIASGDNRHGELTPLEYLKLDKIDAFFYGIERFVAKIPVRLKALILLCASKIKGAAEAVKDEILDIIKTFAKGNWAVKLSFLVFGFGNLYYGQVLRGLLFLLFEVVFLVYTFLPTGGIYWINKVQWFVKGATVGTVQEELVYDPTLDLEVKVPGDDSVRVLLYGLLSVMFIIAFVVTWRMQVKQCRINMEIKEKGKKINSAKDDLKSLLDEQFYKTLLTPSLLGILIFTVFPIIYMVIIAFTNYDSDHNGQANLFSWVGLDNFNAFTGFGEGKLNLALGEMVGWTLMWAFFATFTNYFLGMFVAIVINKKGIRFKKFWRTVLVMTIAIPQFVSLMYVGRMFNLQGMIGSFLDSAKLIPASMIAQNQFTLWDNPVTSKILLVVINMWVGVPYVMLMATGILMNIPADLYESSRVDGANSVQQFTKITLPYMLFVTGPSLLTSFVGNLNNFNIIYLLSGGRPTNTSLGVIGGEMVGYTDLLITFLFKVAMGTKTKHYLASVLGIFVFILVALLSLVVYNVMPSTKSEEDFN